MARKKTKQGSYDDRQKKKGLIKTCVWVTPNCAEKIQAMGERDRKKNGRAK